MAFSHAKLIDAKNDTRYALSDVGEAPEFAVPTRAFQIEEIISRRLHILVWTEENGWKKQLDKTTGEPLLTESPVSGFQDRTKRVRCYGDLGEIAHEEGMVAVFFGAEPLQEPSFSKPCCDVSDARTPRSDVSDPEHERFLIS